MKTLDVLRAQVVNVALTIFLVATWLGLSAYLDTQPSETDALRASALDKSDAVRDAIADAQDRRDQLKGPQ